MTNETSKELTYQASKADIWQAYKSLKESSAQPKSAPPAREPEMNSSALVKGVLQDIARLRGHINEMLAGLADSLTNEAGRLDAVEKKIGEKQAELKVLHDIETKAQTLDELDRQIALEKTKWLEEKRQRDAAAKRQEEEYGYELKKREARAADDLEAKRLAFERELRDKRADSERELASKRDALKKKEVELTELERKLAALPKELERSNQETSARLKIEYEERLTSERALSTQEIRALKENVARQEKEIVNLRQQLLNAHEQLKEMAVGALKGQDRPAGA